MMHRYYESGYRRLFDSCVRFGRKWCQGLSYKYKKYNHYLLIVFVNIQLFDLSMPDWSGLLHNRLKS